MYRAILMTNTFTDHADTGLRVLHTFKVLVVTAKIFMHIRNNYGY